MAERGALEELQILRQMPRQFSVTTDDSIAGHGDDGNELRLSGGRDHERSMNVGGT